MTRLGIRGPALRTGFAAGLPAAAVVWIAFIALGGSGGMRHVGALLPMAVFIVEVVLYGYAGFRLRQGGHDQLTAMQGGLVAGWTSALFAAFPRSAMLLLSTRYMAFLQGYNAEHLYMPWPPFTVLLALVGALLASTALGAACGSIGGSFARPDRSAPETQLP